MSEQAALLLPPGVRSQENLEVTLTVWDNRRRFRTGTGNHGRVHDAVVITCASVAGGSLIAEVALAATQAPPTALAAVGGLGSAAFVTLGVYLGRKSA